MALYVGKLLQPILGARCLKRTVLEIFKIKRFQWKSGYLIYKLNVKWRSIWAIYTYSTDIWVRCLKGLFFLVSFR